MLGALQNGKQAGAAGGEGGTKNRPLNYIDSTLSTEMSSESMGLLFLTAREMGT